MRKPTPEESKAALDLHRPTDQRSGRQGQNLKTDKRKVLVTRAKESKAALDLHRPTDQRSPTEPVLEAAAADLPVEVVRRLEAELEAASVRATPIGRGLEVAIRRRWRRTFEAARELPARQRAAVIKVYAAHLLGAPLAPDAGEAQAFARGAFQFWSDGGEP